MKKCFKCGFEKPLDSFYKHNQMPDGHLNKCIDCAKNDTKLREAILRKDPNFVESERARTREKYHRLNYKNNKPNKEHTKAASKQHNLKYPEKKKAKSATTNMKAVNGNLHHWSYNGIHYKDVIDLSVKDHAKAHRFIIYDPERMMYRRCDNLELLDTKEKHLNYIMECITTKPN